MKTVSIEPSKGEQLESLQIAPAAMIIYPGQQFNHLGTKPVVGGIIKDQNLLSFLADQYVEKMDNNGHQRQHELSPVMPEIIKEVISCILLESQVGIPYNPSGKITPF